MEQKSYTLPIIEQDDWLKPVAEEVVARHARYEEKMRQIEASSGTISDYANGYHHFGWQWDDALDGWWLREWLPGAEDVYLFGDFNNWQRTELRMKRDPEGVWSIFLPAAMYRDRLTHGSLYKIHVHGPNGWMDRIPAYAFAPMMKRPTVPVEVKIAGIVHRVSKTGQATMAELLESEPSLPDLVASFMGILELLKLRRILIDPDKDGTDGENAVHGSSTRFLLNPDPIVSNEEAPTDLLLR